MNVRLERHLDSRNVGTPTFCFYVRIWANKKLNTVLYGSQYNNRFRICNTELRLI